jgi:hypothetical protein
MQGGEGDCFYVVGSGEYEVLAIQVYIPNQIYAMCTSDFGLSFHAIKTQLLGIGDQ